MSTTNQERVGKAMDLLRGGLAPFVDREFQNRYQESAHEEARSHLNDDRYASMPFAEWDVALLLKLMWASWNVVFKQTLGRAERSLVQELRDCRNDWAHEKAFSSDDTDRKLSELIAQGERVV